MNLNRLYRGLRSVVVPLDFCRTLVDQHFSRFYEFLVIGRQSQQVHTSLDQIHETLPPCPALVNKKTRDALGKARGTRGSAGPRWCTE